MEGAGSKILAVTHGARFKREEDLSEEAEAVG